MTRGDELMEHGAERLETLADKDAAFLRKLKPSLVAKRVRGGASPLEPAPPQPAARAKAKAHGGPNPLLVAVAAFALGVAIAKLIDWRGHAHPRR